MNGHCTVICVRTFRPVLLSLLGLLTLVGAGCRSAERETQRDARDNLLGWFQCVAGDRVVPVFKREGNYYSVCHGFEVPLTECADGLTWALQPSSMTGTTIGWNSTNGTPYLAVFDSQASNFTDGRYGVGDKEDLRRIEQPPTLHKARAQRPRRNEDFVGSFEAVWQPGVWIEIYREHGRYFERALVLRAQNWERMGEPRELTPLPDQLGFTGFERNNRQRLIYNAALKRFEIVLPGDAKRREVLRMPLARASDRSGNEAAAVNSARMTIGIPSWR